MEQLNQRQRFDQLVKDIAGKHPLETIRVHSDFWHEELRLAMQKMSMLPPKIRNVTSLVSAPLPDNVAQFIAFQSAERKLFKEAWKEVENEPYGIERHFDILLRRNTTGLFFMTREARNKIKEKLERSPRDFYRYSGVKDYFGNPIPFPEYLGYLKPSLSIVGEYKEPITTMLPLGFLSTLEPDTYGAEAKAGNIAYNHYTNERLKEMHYLDSMIQEHFDLPPEVAGQLFPRQSNKV